MNVFLHFFFLCAFVAINLIAIILIFEPISHPTSFCYLHCYDRSLQPVTFVFLGLNNEKLKRSISISSENIPSSIEGFPNLVILCDQLHAEGELMLDGTTMPFNSRARTIPNSD